MTKKEQILKAWKTLKKVHPSYQEIADQVSCNKTYVFKVIQEEQFKQQIKGRK